MVFSKYNFSLCDKRGRHIFDQDAESSETTFLFCLSTQILQNSYRREIWACDGCALCHINSEPFYTILIKPKCNQYGTIKCL